VTSVINTPAPTHIPARRLVLENTESAFLENSLTNFSTLQQLQGLGVRFALDDFGTGYSSLGCLLNFPFNKIKIDQSFVADLSHDDQSRAIVCAITNLAHNLNMSVVVEGIETKQQLEQVKLLGCTELQGYLFSPPLPSAEIRKFFPASDIKAGCAA